jgi:fatty-acyl-CoA synthase
MTGGIAGIADIEAIETVALADRDLPPSTLAAIERGAATVGPDKAALHFMLRGTHWDQASTWTYGELIRDVRRTANLLRRLGVGDRDVTSLLLPNLPETFFAVFGGETAGIVNPINPLLEPDVIAEIMNAAGTKVLVTLGPFPGTDIWPKVEVLRDRVPSLETILTVDLARHVAGPAGAALRAARWLRRPSRGRQSVLDFHRELDRHGGERLEFEREIEPGDVASYFHTGGTTGVPKLAVHSHGNEVFDAWSGAQTVGTRADQVLFCGLPLFHVNGVIITGLTPLSFGATVVLGTPQGYRGAGVIPNFWRIVERYRIASFSGVPTVYAALLDVPVDGARIESLEFAICGAAPMPVELFREFERRTGVTIIEGYGLTEGTCACCANPPRGERKVGSVGLRFPHTELMVAVVDAAGKFERSARPNEVGSVLLRGPHVFPGYHDRAHEEGIWIDAADGGDRWLDTGDLGRLDDDGYLWLTGRRKEMIIRGGHNIDPALVEEPLCEHPAVLMAAAVGRPDVYAGEVPVAYVQLMPGAEATEEELLRFAAERIGERAGIPKAVRTMDTLPTTAVGKIFKLELRRAEIADALGEAVRALPEILGCDVEVVPEPARGEVALCRIRPAEGIESERALAEARRILGHFAVTSEVVLGD